MMAGAAIWALLYSFELTTPTLSGKLFWAKTEYVGIALLPVAWLLFARSYTGATRKLGLGALCLVSLIPALTVVFAATNESHVLLWRDIYVNTSGSFPSLTLVHGPWFWVHVVYSYGLLALGSYLLLRTGYRYPRIYRRQAVMLFVATAAPWLGNGLSIFWLLPSRGIDVTPFAFTITGVALLLAMSRLRLLNLLPALLPTARSQLLQKMRDGVLVLDLDGRVVTLNPAAIEMLGVRGSDLMGKPAAELLGNTALATPEASVSGNSQFGFTLGEGDSRRYFEVVSSSLGLTGKGGMGQLLVLRDITERKNMEEALRQSEDRYRVLAEATSDAIYSYNTELKLTGINQSAARMLGLEPDEALDKNLGELGFTRDTLAQWKRMTRKVLNGGRPVREHLTVVMPDGGPRTYETVLQPVFDAESKILGVRGVSSDISERKKAEEGLRESEERYRALFETMLEGFAYCQMIYDDEGRPIDWLYLSVNSAFATLTGLEDIVGRRVTESHTGD